MSRLSLALVATVAALAVAPGVHAQDKRDGLWHGDASLGGALSSGNNDSLRLTANANTSRATESDKISVYTAANYGRTKVDGEEQTTADLLRLGGRYDFNVSEHSFAFGAVEGETNEAGAGVRDRYNVNSGLGVHVVRNDSHNFDLFGGVGYTDTRFVDDTSERGAQLVLGQESKHKLTDTTTLNQRLTYYSKAGDLGARVNFDAGLATQIAGGWTLNAGLSSRYNSEVPEHLKKTDNLLTVGFGYKF
jgi:putative salt-induced outer membrane protein